MPDDDPVIKIVFIIVFIIACYSLLIIISAANL